jgi:putative transcriptional regulator
MRSLPRVLPPYESALPTQINQHLPQGELQCKLHLQKTNPLMKITHNYRNHFLIAMPTLRGEFFSKSVVYIYEHTPETGAIGFTINKPLSATLGNVMEHLNIKIKDDTIYDIPVFSGGPMGPDQGFVIHDRMVLAENDDDTDITLSTSRDILEDIAKGKGPEHAMVILGYASWEPGQLEKEIKHNDWLLTPMQKTIVFDTPIAQRWVSAARLIGVDIHKLSNQTGHA